MSSSKRRSNVESLVYGMSEDDESNNEQSDVDSEVFSSARSSRQESNTSGKETTRGWRGTRAGSTSKRPCLNRNALLARENRRRKKEYMEKIENKLSHYKRANEHLSSTIQRQGIDLKRLQAEVSYLRNVINNNSSITNLLKSMNETLSSGRNGSCDADGRKRLARDPNFADDESASPPHDWRSEKQESTRREMAGKRSEANERLSHAESDHTYTSTGDGSVFGDTSSSYPIDNDDNEPYTADSKDLFALDDPLVHDIIDGPLDRLPRLDDNIFGSVDDTFDYDRINFDQFEPDASTKLFDNLENSGVCLHVNSGRISLEFCSICHLNSVNASE